MFLNRPPEVGDTIRFLEEFLDALPIHSEWTDYRGLLLKVTNSKNDGRHTDISFKVIGCEEKNMISLYQNGRVAGPTTSLIASLLVFELIHTNETVIKQDTVFCSCAAPILVTNSCLGKSFQVCKLCKKEKK